MSAAEQKQMRARAIAFYLPQFYPTPENDEWWGKGFTEWTNVAKTRPLFPGHYQPRLPADLGFYDLRVPETRAAQAQMAQQHGIEGFCYWHYWFEGRRLLELPFNEVLHSGEPDFPFCLAWANHTWSRAWSGEEKEILVSQTYSAADDVNHARWLINAFADKRYIRINNRPLFVIYNPHHLPDAWRTTDTFRKETTNHGLPEPYLVGINLAKPDVDTQTLGFDMTLNHQPQFMQMPKFSYAGKSKSRFFRNLKYGVFNENLRIHDYRDAMDLMIGAKTAYASWPCVVSNWDTTARRGERALILTQSTPEAFESVLRSVVDELSGQPPEEQFLFLNAWNEWGEGMYLEPDTKFGMRYLEAVRNVVCKPTLQASSFVR